MIPPVTLQGWLKIRCRHPALDFTRNGISGSKWPTEKAERAAGRNSQIFACQLARSRSANLCAIFWYKTLEVNSISDHLTVTTPLPRYLPYARFLLDTDLSHTAKLLYTLLLDRATLSQKNNWIDAQGRIYVIYSLSNLAKDLGCSVSSVTRSFTELENAQLVERVRSGFSKPSRILLKIPLTTQNCTVTVCKNAEHDCAEMSSMIAQKCTPNQRNKSNLKDSHLIRTTDAHLTFGEWIKKYF